MTTPLLLNLSDDARKQLQDLAAARGLSVEELIEQWVRRATVEAWINCGDV
jgi:hypothetical protein